MLDTTIQVKTQYFDGPLALLLFLVQKEEMDIKKFDLTVITKQYLVYLTEMQELNFDIAGDYLYLAATLLLLKSNVCITEEDQSKLREGLEGDLHITSQAELIRRLEELQHYQRMSEKLWALPKRGHEIFVRPKVDRKAIVNSILTPMDLQSLTQSMMDVMRREKRKFTVVKRDRLSIKEKLQFLKDLLKKGEQTDFEDILNKGPDQDIDNIVITFISLLELARLGKITLFQNENYSNIYVKVLESLENFNVDMADGFEAEGDAEAPLPEILTLSQEQVFIGEEMAENYTEENIDIDADQEQTQEQDSIQDFVSPELIQ